jgi:hypothetical protein
MNTTMVVVLPAWAVWMVMVLCVVSIVEMTMRAINAVLRGMLERRQMRQNTTDDRPQVRSI